METNGTNLLRQTNTQFSHQEIAELRSLSQAIHRWIIASKTNIYNNSDPRYIIQDGRAVHQIIPHHFFADDRKDKLFMKAWYLLLQQGKVRQVDVSHKSQKISYSITASNAAETNLQYILEAFQKASYYNLEVHS